MSIPKPDGPDIDIGPSMLGICWTLYSVAGNAPSSHSLEQMVSLAREVGGEEHGFRFIQLPFNLAMPEALVLQNQTLNGKQIGRNA